VLTRLGMEAEQQVEINSEPATVYRLDRADHERRFASTRDGRPQSSG
jgi:hypothetical protein